MTNRTPRNALLAVLLISIGAGALHAADIGVRDLVRGRVTECASDATPAVNVIIQQVETEEGFVDPGVTVVGDNIQDGLSCETFDSRVNSWVDGTLIEIKDGYALSGVVYSATVSNGRATYKVADYAAMTPASMNGARYYARSYVMVGEDGLPIEYNIDYIRRQQEGIADIPASIMMIEREVIGSTLLFTLDYRDEEKDVEEDVEDVEEEDVDE